MTDNWGKIALAGRCAKLTWGAFAVRWTHLLLKGVRYNQGDIVLGLVSGRPAHTAANMLVRAFLLSPADTLLLIDDDNLVTAETVNALRDDERLWEYDGAGALYVMRDGTPIAMKAKDVPDDLDLPAVYRFPTDLAEIEEVDAMGLGCTLIRRHVFEEVASAFDLAHVAGEEQWFAYPTKYLGTEDVWLYRMARQLGLRFAIATSFAQQAPHASEEYLYWDPGLNTPRSGKPAKPTGA